MESGGTPAAARPAARTWVVVSDEWLGPMTDAEALRCTERLRGRLRQLGLPTDAVQMVVGEPEGVAPVPGRVVPRRRPVARPIQPAGQGC